VCRCPFGSARTVAGEMRQFGTVSHPACRSGDDLPPQLAESSCVSVHTRGPRNRLLPLTMMRRLFFQLMSRRTENTILQVPRALVAACIATGFDVLLLMLLVERVGMQPRAAAVIGFLFGCVPHYILCAVWVFPASPNRAPLGFIRFMVLSVFGLALTWALVAGMHDKLGLNYLFAKAVAMVLSFSFNFLCRKYFIFRQPRRDEIPASETEELLPSAAIANSATE
jgi:putative flippase GtrA